MREKDDTQNQIKRLYSFGRICFYVAIFTFIIKFFIDIPKVFYFFPFTFQIWVIFYFSIKVLFFIALGFIILEVAGLFVKTKETLD